MSALALAVVASASNTSFADEGGVSFWVPGFFGSLAATPQQPGFSLATIYYHTTVNAGGDVAFARQVSRGGITANLTGNINASLNANADLGFAIPTYVFAAPVLGGQAAVSMIVPYGRNSVGVDATLMAALGPIGFTLGGSRTDTTWGFGDLIPQASLKWNMGVHNVMTYITGDIPVGAYDSTRLANLGIGHGAIDGGVGYTYFNPQTGHEFSAVAGLTYNLVNNSTNYQNGVDFHLDWGASQFLTKQLQVGLVGYAYKELGCDSGSGDRVGCFQSQVFGVGPQLGFIIPLSATPSRLHQSQGLQGIRCGGSALRLECVGHLRDLAGCSSAARHDSLDHQVVEANSLIRRWFDWELGTDLPSVPSMRSPVSAADPGGTPYPGQARASGIATNFVASSDFNRISTVRLPSFWASPMALRTSTGVATFLPPTSRMTSPVFMPCSEAMPSGSTLVIDDAVGTAALHLTGGSDRQAEPRHVGAGRIGLGLSDPGLALVRQFAERERDGLVLALAPDRELHRSARRKRADLLGEIAGILHGIAVDRGDHVAGEDPGLGGRTVRLRLGDQRALRRLEAEVLGDLGRDRLNLHADPTAGDAALVLELGDDRLHRLGRDREGDADRPAGRREDRGVDADHVAVDVEGRAAGVALVDRGIDLQEVVVGAGADVAAAGRDDAGRDGAAEAERIADRQHPVADARRIRGEADEREVGAAFGLDQRQIGARIGADHLGLIGLAVIGRDFDGAGVVRPRDCWSPHSRRPR